MNVEKRRRRKEHHNTTLHGCMWIRVEIYIIDKLN
jgi:hypothetical protein